MLVHGIHGAVGSLAAQLAYWGGATVIGTVRHSRHSIDAATALGDVVTQVVALNGRDPVARIREVAPDGVNRIIEVALSANADFDAEVAAQGAVIAAYSSPADRPALPPYPLDDIAAAHQAVEAGSRGGRILVSIGG